MLDFKVLTHQRDFINATSNTMLVAGYRAGKSHGGTLKTILKKLQYPKNAVAYYLPTYPLIKDIAFVKFPDLLDELKIKYRLNKSDKEIHIENYNKIIFRSMDNPDNIVGYEVAYSLIDEADILPIDKMDRAYKKILARNSITDEPNVDAVSTPEGYKWLYNQSISGYFKVIRAKTLDNKFISKGYIEELTKQYPPQLLEAYLNGKFVNLTSGVVYSYFDRTKHHTSERIKDKEILHIGQDFNIGGCKGKINVIRDDKPLMLDEYSVNDTQSIINYLKSNFSNHKIFIYPDASGKAHKTNASRSDIQMLKDAGFNVIARNKNPLVKDRVNVLNNMFYNNEYLINTDMCTDATKALEQQVYDKNGIPEKFNGAGTIDDDNDATGYFIYNRFGLIKNTFEAKKVQVS